MVVSRNPATGATVFEGPPAGAAGVDAALERASAALAPWAGAPEARRQEVLEHFADLVERDAAHLEDLIVSEMGKRHDEASGEVAWTVQSARYYAAHPPASLRQGDVLVHRRPLGVVAAITPWNVPLLTPAWKWLPALVAGNTVVWKPSELSSATAVAAWELLREAGLPEGALEVVLGGAPEAKAICADRRVAGVHFTGSCAAGRSLGAIAGQRGVPCALEMGGLNAAIVFDDADIGAAARDILSAATAINGQKCTATRRVLVQSRAADDLVAALVSGIESLAVGDPKAPGIQLGPLVSAGAAHAATTALETSLRAGARLLGQSPPPSRTGVNGEELLQECFFPVTLLGELAPDDRLRTEELFAPVITLEVFRSASDAWAAANRSDYGLSAAVFTADERRAAEAPQRLDCGIVCVNRRGDAVELEAPFGGTKASGNGFPEGGEHVYSSLTTLQACYGLPAP